MLVKKQLPIFIFACLTASFAIALIGTSCQAKPLHTKLVLTDAGGGGGNSSICINLYGKNIYSSKEHPVANVLDLSGGNNNNTCVSNDGGLDGKVNEKLIIVWTGDNCPLAQTALLLESKNFRGMISINPDNSSPKFHDNELERLKGRPVGSLCNLEDVEVVKQWLAVAQASAKGTIRFAIEVEVNVGMPSHYKTFAIIASLFIVGCVVVGFCVCYCLKTKKTKNREEYPRSSPGYSD